MPRTQHGIASTAPGPTARGVTLKLTVTSCRGSITPDLQGKASKLQRRNS